jgi:diphthine-ammonia ligase
MNFYAMPEFLFSWSGGKDSCLALYRALQAGGSCSALLTMLDENGERSRSHGLRPEVLEAQARAMKLPLHVGLASWSSYEAVFVEQLQTLRESGVTAAVFGDIDLEDHRQWEEKVCARVGLKTCLPLWKAPRRALLDEFLAAGFTAIVVAAREDRLPPDCLGRVLDEELIAWIESHGCDACGEEGEYHSVVVNGPLFHQPLQLIAGERSLHGGCWFLDFQLAKP